MHDHRAQPLTRDDVVSVVGPVDEEKITAIMATGATPTEVIEAFAWTGSDSDRMAEAGKTLTGRVATVYEILTAEDEAWEDDGR